ncbi:MAG TPA: hypothetical protein VG674_33120 [Amycolatopsis sp.]|nr:hypothetical protein [Amycolatopsis sp.]
MLFRPLLLRLLCVDVLRGLPALASLVLGIPHRLEQRRWPPRSPIPGPGLRHARPLHRHDRHLRQPHRQLLRRLATRRRLLRLPPIGPVTGPPLGLPAGRTFTGAVLGLTVVGGT